MDYHDMVYQDSEQYGHFPVASASHVIILQLANIHIATSKNLFYYYTVNSGYYIGAHGFSLAHAYYIIS